MRRDEDRLQCHGDDVQIAARDIYQEDAQMCRPPFIVYQSILFLEIRNPNQEDRRENRVHSSEGTAGYLSAMTGWDLIIPNRRSRPGVTLREPTVDEVTTGTTAALPRSPPNEWTSGSRALASREGREAGQTKAERPNSVCMSDMVMDGGQWGANRAYDVD